MHMPLYLHLAPYIPSTSTSRIPKHVDASCTALSHCARSDKRSDFPIDRTMANDEKRSHDAVASVPLGGHDEEASLALEISSRNGRRRRKKQP